MRVVTANLNGLRSAASKGFLDWMLASEADFICVQELKARALDLTPDLQAPSGYRGYFHFADKPGYSGVGLYSRASPSSVVIGLNCPEFDAEGRYVELRFDSPKRPWSIISCYFPSGSSSEARQAAKYRFLDIIQPHLCRLSQEREFLLCGDINIAHREVDLKNWRANQKNSGFLPEERAWMDRLLDRSQAPGLVDVYRHLEPDATEAGYTWWSNRGQAWANNVGWRIDYHLATAALAATASKAAIHKASRFSDHAPLTVSYDWEPLSG